ncbi:hypothetical protein [Streptomyces sp. NPDC088727]|uniref:hypothetical protein n=1 Tax=Streptomyces sp. NPDC088727 TaxID=3365875 RepID=UPI00381284F6
MAEIQSGSGFSEAITQMSEATNAAEAARQQGDEQEVARQEERFNNAQSAVQEYKEKKYG